MVLSVAEHSMARYDPRFPIGRGKLEALAVMGCACIMSIASLEVVQFSAWDLYAGFAKGESSCCFGQTAQQAVCKSAEQAASARLLTRPVLPATHTLILPVRCSSLCLQASGRSWT